MTKRLSRAYAQKLLDSSAPDLTSVNLKVAAINASHVDSVAHDFLDDITGGNIVQTSGNLASKTITNGTFDAADLNIGSPASGTITQNWLYYDTGTASTSLLIYYWNEDASGNAISIVANGEAITYVWNASGIFKIGSS